LLLGGTQLLVIIAYRSSHRSGIDCGYCAAGTKSWIDSKVGGLDCPIQCPLPIAPKWPPVLQLPLDSDLVNELGSFKSTNLTDTSIRRAKHSPVKFLVTGANQPFAESM